MRNLRLHRRTGRSLDFLEDTSLNTERTNLLYAVNPNNDDFYLLFNNKLHKIPSNHEEDVVTYEVDERYKFIDLEYSNIMQELYGACETGEIIRMKLDLEIVYEIEVDLNLNLQRMKFSPDHEIIVVVTTVGTVITMVSTFQVISEVNLYASDFGSKQFVTVGWGKKETQFHGSRGKQAAVSLPSEIIVNDYDDLAPRITWPEDGSKFAVGYVNPENKLREFKVFNREGMLESKSAAANGLGESLSWRPSGFWIATSQNLADQHLIVLYEKCGLQHRTFSLPSETKNLLVKDIFWSPDSEVLTTWCHTRDESSAVLQLWTEKNYHWYVKQTLTFSAQNPLKYAVWSTNSRFKKLILVTSNELITAEYDWSVSHSRGKGTEDRSIVGVIDGNALLLSSFRDATVPPPMSHCRLEISEPVNGIAFAPDITHCWINSNVFFCVLSTGKLIFYKQLDDRPSLEYECVGMYDIDWAAETRSEISLYNLHHHLWLTENIILCSATTANKSLLCVLNVDNVNDKERATIVVQETKFMDGVIEHIVPSPALGEAYIVVERDVFKYSEDGELIPMDVQLPEYAYKVEVVKIGAADVFLSLSHRNCFSIDGKQIANNITSFYVHSEFLLLTTLQHTLVCVTLNEKGFQDLVNKDLTIKPWEDSNTGKPFTDLFVRRVERGSYLIVAIPKDSRTILQMPRGNLECIQPRALSLYIIGYHLNECNYSSAFDLMRRQRINLNIIYDHDPEKFVKNVVKFVDEISKPNWLSLFLTELQNENVTSTTYSNYYWHDLEKPTNDSANKVEFVCDLLRDVMEKRSNADQLIQPILISLVKSKRAQGLEGALAKIRELQTRTDEGVSKSRNSVTAEEALRYLLYIVDVNVLFDTALGMYDFDLTMLVASMSQKDPKEYVPFLNELKKLDENYMKYSIDLHLKRYESALKHIVKENGRFNECLNLIRNHNLYTKALQLFAKDSKEYKEVARNYGEVLLKRNKYPEAGIMFSKSEDYEQALAAYKLAGSWQEAIIVSAKMNLSSYEKQELYKGLVEYLKSDRRYFDAANILKNYMNDVEEAIALLCDGKHWKDAIRISHDVQRLDLIESHVKPGIHEYASHILLQIQTSKEEWEKHKSRLTTVRQNILKKKKQLLDGILEDDGFSSNRGMSDILSDTSSIAGSTFSQKSRSSVSSGRSYRSSKNRRKQERKLLSQKEGGAFEDLGLMQALYQIITNTYKQKGDVSAIVQMLVYYGDDKSAEEIQTNFDEFLHLIEKSKQEIWNKSAPSSLTELENADLTAAELQELSISQKLVEPYITRPPETNSVHWKLEIF